MAQWSMFFLKFINEHAKHLKYHSVSPSIKNLSLSRIFIILINAKCLIKKRGGSSKRNIMKNKQHTFIIRGIMFNEQTPYYILEGEDGYRRLMEKAPYEDYQIKVGSKINCRIDKINCNGRYFFEPIHPKYKVGKSFEFKIAKVFSFHWSPYLIYLMEYGSGHHFTYYSTKENPKGVGENISVPIVRISKGRIYPADSFQKTNIPKKQSLILQGFIQYDSQSFHVFSGEDQSPVLVQSDAYLFLPKYVGSRQVFYFFRDKHHKNIIYKEPADPLFLPGDKHQLQFLSYEIKDDLLRGLKHYIYLRHAISGRTFRVNVQNSKTYKDLKIGSIINCCVSRYKKGRIYWDVL